LLLIDSGRKLEYMNKKKLLLTAVFLIASIFAGAQTITGTAATTTATTSTAAPAADTDRGYLVKPGDVAPSDFELKLTDGTKTSLEELKGKIVVLQFTASWCSVCREEMPHLEKDLWQAYKDKGVVLIGVDRDEPLEKVTAFHKVMNISYPLALDPGAEIFGRFANIKSGVTRNVVIGRDGRIAYLTRLYDKQEFSSMLKAIDDLVKQQ
jgi:peroxiredoxin